MGRNGIGKPVRDRFRVPSAAVPIVVDEAKLAEPGFFRFGTSICYGRSAVPNRKRPDEPLHDAMQSVAVRDGKVVLPFDPNEVIDNLRFERYPQPHRRAYENRLKKIYYELRPLTTPRLRRRIQRFDTRKWREIRFPKWPVDTTVETICEDLLLMSLRANGVDEVPFIWFWPRGATGCIVMTHDVETQAGLDFCLKLADLDRTFDIRTAYQLIPERRYQVPKSLLEEIRSRGCEVGVHDLNHDGKLFDDREQFLRRAKKINEYGRQYKANGFRAAVLYRNFDWYDKLEFSFDMSAPNVAPLDPQRGGCCTVMPYFIGHVLEVPLTTTQDYTLFHLLNERSPDHWKVQTKTILDHHGLVSFIVHPDYILDPDYLLVYKNLLRYLAELRSKKSLWFALPGEVDRWWRARDRMSVVKDGNAWKIVGHGAEQAVLAYAKNVKGKLTYEFPSHAVHVSSAGRTS